MFKTMDDFFAVWKKEADFTQRILDGLTDESLKQPVTVEHRNLGRLAWHLTETLKEMPQAAGVVFNDESMENSMPETAKEIAAAYREANDVLVTALEKQWDDSMLKEERDMYGEKWTGSDVLWTLVTHQIHHRGQMTVLMRQAGLKVPGLYGPAKEDWAAMGANAPEI